MNQSFVSVTATPRPIFKMSQSITSDFFTQALQSVYIEHGQVTKE